MSVEAVIDTRRGMIVAPAGCGKTYLITETLRVRTTKPYLVLTHTTAGVAALKQRLKRLGIPHRNYRVATIDGWAIVIANMFPSSCMMREAPENPRSFYPELRNVVNSFLRGGHIEDIIRSSYSRLLVDEYQDCDIAQHALICAISDILPTVVFGDPMQAIFDFGGITIPCWNMVQGHFPQVASLNTPWRWNNVEKQVLGQWILNARNILIEGGSVNLLTCPACINWCKLTGNARTDSQNRISCQYGLRNHNTEPLMIIGDSSNAASRHKFAQMTNGIDVVEPVELSDVMGAASNFDANQGIQLVEQVLAFATTVMTGVKRASLLQRLESILAGRNRTPPIPVELAAKSIVQQGSKESILELLYQLEQQPDSKIYRKCAFSALKAAVVLSISDPNMSIKEAASMIREQRRHSGDKRLPCRALGQHFC